MAELRAAGGDTAVFAHGHILRVLAARWLELAPAEARRFALSTATVSVLGFEHDWPAVWLWNDASHLGTGRLGRLGVLRRPYGTATGRAPLARRQLPFGTEWPETGHMGDVSGHRWETTAARPVPWVDA